MPGAMDVYRYRATARLSVLARLAGVLFLPRRRPSTGCSAASIWSFFVPEAILLTLALTARASERGLAPEARIRIMTHVRLSVAPPTHLARVILVLAVVGGLVTYVKFFREEPPPYFASDEEHFLFGSVGTEGEQGIPYWIWLVLPRVFPEYLPRPGGYASTRHACRRTATRCRSASRR